MKLTKLIYEAGIIGCGGAGFPTHAKYNGTIETIIINGAECEPLLQTDRYLMRNKARELIQAADMLLRETGAGRCVIALKHSYTREIKALEEAIHSFSSSVSLHRLESFFPAGDEQTIVYEVTGNVLCSVYRGSIALRNRLRFVLGRLLRLSLRNPPASYLCIVVRLLLWCILP